MTRIIGNKIKERRIELGMTADELAEKTGKSRATIYRYENGDIENLPTTILEPLAKALETTPAYLMGWSDPTQSPIPNSVPFTPGKYRIPIVGRVAAGLPIYSGDEIEGYIDYDKDPTGLFALRIKGDSMEPRIFDGDIIIVDQEASWSDGDIVVATKNGDDGTCKRIKVYTNGIALLSINPAYDPQIYSSEQVKSLPVEVRGKVIELRAKFK